MATLKTKIVWKTDDPKGIVSITKLDNNTILLLTCQDSLGNYVFSEISLIWWNVEHKEIANKQILKTCCKIENITISQSYCFYLEACDLIYVFFDVLEKVNHLEIYRHTSYFVLKNSDKTIISEASFNKQIHLFETYSPQKTGVYIFSKKQNMLKLIC